ncbi:hypothetical protein [Fictibacillus barbaricus]|uniref:Uncharacterized protein n=1 Tax=Fictibacillus barbaricus TaxID=182136 RepID=A0ABU1TYU6_9BACL|nr:hypothetical protein [Fictibacillus barbaricus]MDR7072389.1 hypothetical protein [Fictibacillus barbaricus]
MKVEDVTFNKQIVNMFTNPFMKKYTNFTTFYELRTSLTYPGSFPYVGAFTDLPLDIWNIHIDENTNFDSWENMQEVALKEYEEQKQEPSK